MKNNIICKLLTSIPIILATLYFSKFLGICLLLFRYIINNDKKIKTPLYIILFGILILIPKIASLIITNFNININIPYLNNIINNNIYNVNLLNYSKSLIVIGILLYIITYIYNLAFCKIKNRTINYISNIEKKNVEISKENDMKMKIKQEKAKNTSYVKCPNCGADNLVTDKFGTCKYCRKKLVNKNYH